MYLCKDYSAKKIVIQKGESVILTVNVNLSDRSVNGQLGTGKDVFMIENIAKTVLVRFDDQYLRKHCMRRARYCSTIQVEMIEIKVPVNPCKTLSPFTNGNQFLLALA